MWYYLMFCNIAEDKIRRKYHARYYESDYAG